VRQGTIAGFAQGICAHRLAWGAFSWYCYRGAVACWPCVPRSSTSRGC